MPAILVALTTMAFAGAASAQEGLGGGGGGGGNVEGGAGAGAGAGAGDVAAGAGGNAGEGSGQGQTDHDLVVRRVGLHYFGSPTVTQIGPMGMPMGSFPVHTVGIRTWFTPRLGFEAGLGLGLAGGSLTRTSGGMSTSFSAPFQMGLGFQAGLPIVLAYYRHINFYVSPFMAFYFGSGGITTGTGAAATSYQVTTVLFQLGGNIGSEIQLGFIGLPQVSIEARFGLRLGIRSDTSEDANQGNVNTNNVFNWEFGTTIGNWSLDQLLTSSVAATYYF